jgi:hypothetical protein
LNQSVIVASLVVITSLGSPPDTTVAAGLAERSPVEELLESPRPEARLTDADVERILGEGTILDIADVGTGVTKPLKVRVELEGVERRAIFKSLDDHRRGITRLQGAPPEMNYSDSYLYERAAYLLDRELGLDMVPVAVLRVVQGREGAIVDWVTGSMTEEERLEQKIEIGKETRKQIAVMRVFDMLINNADRHAGNLLYTTDDWKVHLIDHTRAFRYSRDWLKEYDNQPIRLPRGLLARLEGLDRAGLNEMLAGLVSKERVKSLLQRRDQILKRVDKERKKSGDAFVFLEGDE